MFRRETWCWFVFTERYKYHQRYQYDKHTPILQGVYSGLPRTQQKRKDKKKDGKMIWGNDDILFQGEPLVFAHWSKSWIIYINDIIKDGKIQTNEIYHRLKSEAGYIFGIQTIKSCFIKGCLKSFDSNEDGQPHDLDILNAIIRLPNGLNTTLDV